MDAKDERRHDLLDEIERYLAAVELFRSLDCEPHWRPEAPSVTEVTRGTGSHASPRIAH